METRDGTELFEQRLENDEDRLDRDERRLAVDEARLDREVRLARTNRIVAALAASIGVVLVIAVAALVLSLAALRRNVHAIARAAPDGSVSTQAIQDGAVTAPKLGGHAVERAALAPGAIGSAQLAPHAVRARAVARNALTGAQIREATLARVPSATHARTATSALRSGDAAQLGGLAPSAYVSRLVTVKAASVLSTSRDKGAVIARCPLGLRAISGGAEVRGIADGVAILRSAPVDGQGWLGRAAATGHRSPSWRLVVRAVCG
jgi:hypothetical protein